MTRKADRLTPENLIAAGFEEDTIKPIRMFWFKVRDDFSIRYILNGKHVDWSLCHNQAIDGIPAVLCPQNMRDVQWLIKRCLAHKE